MEFINTMRDIAFYKNTNFSIAVLNYEKEKVIKDEIFKVAIFEQIDNSLADGKFFAFKKFRVDQKEIFNSLKNFKDSYLKLIIQVVRKIQSDSESSF